jgi:DNA primase
VTARHEAAARWDLDEVLSRTDLASLLDEVTQPGSSGARGRRWHCPVPQHDDTHPSVTVSTDRRGHERWRCWSGGDTHRGDAIDLAKVTQSLATGEAIDWLARRAGMIPGVTLPSSSKRKGPPAPRYVPLDPAVERYVSACERILWGRGGRDVLGWLHQRGFSDEILRANRAGADPGRERMFRAKELPFGPTPAAVMPALAPDGTLAYVQARYLEPIDGWKYDNPASSLGTNPRLAWTQTAGEPSAGPLVVCEGIPDAWTAAQAGYASVGILGNQSPDASVARRIAAVADDHGQDIVAVIDNDDAGRIWRDNLTTLLTDEGHTLTIIEPPAPGLDLNAWSLQDPTWVATRPAGGIGHVAL